MHTTHASPTLPEADGFVPQNIECGWIEGVVCVSGGWWAWRTVLTGRIQFRVWPFPYSVAVIGSEAHGPGGFVNCRVLAFRRDTGRNFWQICRMVGQ